MHKLISIVKYQREQSKLKCSSEIAALITVSLTTYLLLVTFFINPFIFLILLPDGNYEPQMTILEERHPYGNEFFGGQASLVVTPITERCFLTMAMVILFSYINCSLFNTNEE